MQIDALKEVANIGAGHAATQLSQLLDTTIRLEAPRAEVIRFRDLHSRLANNGTFAVLHTKVGGQAPGHLVVLFDQRDALEFVALCLKRIAEDLQIHDSIVEPTLKKMTHLVATSYLSAIAQLAGTELVSSHPAFSYGVLRTTLDTFMPISPRDEVFFVESTFIERVAKLSAHLVFIPETGSLAPLLAAFNL